MSRLLAVHVVAGAVALLLGPPAVLGVRPARAPYRVLVVVVAGTALLLCLSGSLPNLVRAVLAVVAVGTAAAVVRGSNLALRASLVSLATAVAVVSGPLWSAAVVLATGTAWAHRRRPGDASRVPPGPPPHSRGRGPARNQQAPAGAAAEGMPWRWTARDRG